MRVAGEATPDWHATISECPLSNPDLLAAAESAARVVQGARELPSPSSRWATRVRRQERGVGEAR